MLIPNIIIDKFLGCLSSVELIIYDQLLYKKGSLKDELVEVDIKYEGKILGALRSDDVELASKVSEKIAPLFIGKQDLSKIINYNAKLLGWIESARLKAVDIIDWIGIYFREDYLFDIKSTDLLLGPYIGSPTAHFRINISKGICGQALREKRVINISDVRNNDQHIACSFTTSSELVVPIADKNGNYFAELDIDSDTKDAFSKELEEYFYQYVKTYPYS